MAKKQKKPDYRKLKKALNKYYAFSFPMPRKGKEFSPQQKSAITRKYNKIKSVIDNPTVSFIPYPKKSKLPGVDGIRTTRGLFYKFPDATLRYDKKAKKYRVAVAPKPPRGAAQLRKRVDVFYPFPPHIRFDIQGIKEFVEDLQRRKRPDEIRWSIADRRMSEAYDVEKFDFYFSTFIIDEEDEELDDWELDDEEVKQLPGEIANAIWRKRKWAKKGFEDASFYNGVFLIYYKRNR